MWIGCAAARGFLWKVRVPALTGQIMLVLGFVRGLLRIVGLLLLRERWRRHVDINGEFDPGSGRTLAACLTHASRTVMGACTLISGERVSNT